MNTFIHQPSTKSLLDELDKGIDDMESGNEASIDDAYRFHNQIFNEISDLSLSAFAYSNYS